MVIFISKTGISLKISEFFGYLLNIKKAGPFGPGFYILPSIATPFSGAAALSETSA
jgi:hypothetical protein